MEINKQSALANVFEPISFNEVEDNHLRALGVSKGPPIKFNMAEIRRLSSSRQLSTRFTENRRIHRRIKVSPMEVWLQSQVLNYVQESETEPGAHIVERDTHEAYFALGHHIQPVQVKSPSAEITLQGTIDLITFTAEKEVSIPVFKSDAVVNTCIPPTPCIISVKMPDQTFSDDILNDGVAQALAFTELFQKDQRFVLTNCKSWQFCTLLRDSGTYSVSDILDVDKDGDAVIFTVLDEWVWKAKDCRSHYNVWSLGSP